MSETSDLPNGFQERLRQRQALRSRPLETIPLDGVAQTHGNIPNTPLAAALISFLLGSVFALGTLTFLCGGFSQFWWSTYQAGFFVAAWAAFHWGEFAVTAGWNREKCSVDSFLLDNGALYHIANGLALFEYLTTVFWKSSMKQYPYLSTLGVVMVIFGQALRSAAMIRASTNFSHSVAFRKRETHELVTDGVYAYCRHPSYAGFFYWALGTQLVLQNPFSFIVFVALLWRFFQKRVEAEEKALVGFFGQAYVDYRNKIGTMIPFIR
ncbi:ICMT-domain-containing protein [Dentipellis sp. KUC8613]|nr:ICMT-domain-containing protein [Dentipellis sp. KUC8613]